MADGDIKVSISVEKVLHQTLIDFAQKYRDEHGICIRTVDFHWLGASLAEQSPTLVVGCRVASQLGDV